MPEGSITAHCAFWCIGHQLPSPAARCSGLRGRRGRNAPVLVVPREVEGPERGCDAELVPASANEFFEHRVHSYAS